MSTKTLRKRIALVAVSALGFGLVSAAPSNAAAASATTFSLSSYSIAAGTGITASIGGAVAEHGLVVVYPDGTTEGIGGEVTNAALGTSSTVANDASTVTFSTAAFLEPGTYTVYGVIGANGEIDSEAELIAAVPTVGAARTLTVTNPATSTSVVTSMNAATYAADSAPRIRAWRPAGASGTIKFRVDRSADTTPTLGTVYAATTAGTNYASYTVAGGNDDTAGTYIYTAWVDTNGNDLVDSTEASGSSTFYISAAAAAVTASLNKTSFTDANAYDDFTFTATVTDALGRAVTGETVNVSECSSAGADVATSFTDIADNTAMTNVTGTNSYYINGSIDTAATADTNTVYLCAFIGADVAAGVTAELVSIKSLTVNAVADLVADGTTSMSMSTGAGIGSYDATTGLQQDLVGDDGTDIAATVDPSVTSITYTGTALAADAGEAIVVTVTPKNGTTAVAGSWSIASVLADQSFTYTVAATFADTNGYTISFVGAATNVSAVITFAAAAPQWSTSPAASWTALNGSTNSITGTLSDQYGRPLASKQVIATVTGRNPGTTVLTTDAAGKATWSAKDVSTSTVLLTDSVQFTYNDVDADAAARATSSTARVITYAATLAAVGTVTVVDNDADDSVSIDQVGSAATTAANLVAYTATVKTAAGAPVGSGVLVTFAGGADDIFYGSSSGVTTSTSNGQVTVYVYRHKLGYSTITATSNGVSSTAHGTVKWVNVDADARNISVTAATSVVAGSTGTVIATVTDRWGNPIVSGVDVTFAISGVGRLQTGSSLAAATTDTNGQRQIQLTSNDTETGVVTVTASHAGARGLDTAGYYGADAVTGLTAGNQIATTTVTFTKSTATSTADALLALAQALGTKDQASAAVDAAAEATDAANAATDAANAAAEAADAATAAAQDAADAVAALSTQVSEMVASLKKQIVSLTNLVIKIQKKVKA
jgi:hypothetical protein